MGYSVKFILFLGVALFASACQKVDPKVLGFGSHDDSLNGAEPQKGRVTLGSDDGPQLSSGGTYKLRGRVSAMDPAASSSAPDARYKLSGTMRF